MYPTPEEPKNRPKRVAIIFLYNESTFEATFSTVLSVFSFTAAYFFLV